MRGRQILRKSHIKPILGDPATSSCHSIPFHCASPLWHCACVVEHLGLLLLLAMCCGWAWTGGQGIAGPREVNGFNFDLMVCFYLPQSAAVCIDGSVLGKGSDLGSQVKDWKHSRRRSESWFDLMLLSVSSQAAVVAQALGAAPSQQGRLCPTTAAAPAPWALLGALELLQINRGRYNE